MSSHESLLTTKPAVRVASRLAQFLDDARPDETLEERGDYHALLNDAARLISDLLSSRFPKELRYFAVDGFARTRARIDDPTRG